MIGRPAEARNEISGGETKVILKILTTIPVTILTLLALASSAIADYIPTGNVLMTLTDTDFKCKNGYSIVDDGGGFDRCELRTVPTLTSRLSTKVLQAYGHCEATVIYRQNSLAIDQKSLLREEFFSDVAYGFGIAQVSMELRPITALTDPIISAKVTDFKCVVDQLLLMD